MISHPIDTHLRPRALMRVLAMLLALVATLVLAPIATASAETAPAEDVAPAQDVGPAVIASADLVVTASDGGAGPIGGVPGSDTFTYTISVDNAGPSDASATATLTDVLPPGVQFVAYGTLPVGVTCAPPDGRTLECTIAASLLAVSSPAVIVAVDVVVPATTPGGEVTNKVVVDSPDDPAPCTVTASDITCAPIDTDNASQLVTPVIQIIPDPAPPTVTPTTPTAPTAPVPTVPAVEVSPAVEVRGASLAFTGSDHGWLALVGAALVGVGMVLVLTTRRREQSAT